MPEQREIENFNTSWIISQDKNRICLVHRIFDSQELSTLTNLSQDLIPFER